MNLESKIKLAGQILRLILGGGGFALILILKFNGGDVDIYWLIVSAIILAIKPEDIPKIIKEWRNK